MPADWSWRDSRAWGVCLVVLYLALALLPVVLALSLNPRTGEPFLAELGKGAALLGFSLLSLQVALSGRIKALDRPFGLDVVMWAHKCMAVLATILLISHPLLLAVGEHGVGLLGLGTGWRIWMGKGGLLLLVLVAGLALFFQRMGIEYQVWRYSHKVAPAVVVLGFVHSMAVGPDVALPAVRAYWWALMVMVGVIFLYRNAYIPLWGRRKFRVASVTAETSDTFTVALEPRDDGPLPHRPGQFMYLKLHRPGRPSEEHPFTISSSPTGEWPLTATIKQSGDYTDTIDQTREGDTAGVEAPFGRFSYLHHDPSRLVFIAGGVGITPIMCMLRYLRDTGDKRPVNLIYGVRTEEEIIFRQELDALPENVEATYVLSHPGDEWEGPTGYVTREIIKQCAGDALGEADVYVCGPPLMMDMVFDELKALGVEDRRIHYERFAV